MWCLHGYTCPCTRAHARILTFLPHHSIKKDTHMPRGCGCHGNGLFGAQPRVGNRLLWMNPVFRKSLLVTSSLSEEKRNGSTWAADMPRWLTWPFTPGDVMSSDRTRWNQNMNELHDEAGISIRGPKTMKRAELIAPEKVGDINIYHFWLSSRRVSPLSSLFKHITRKVKVFTTLTYVIITVSTKLVEKSAKSDESDLNDLETRCLKNPKEIVNSVNIKHCVEKVLA